MNPQLHDAVAKEAAALAAAGTSEDDAATTLAALARGSAYLLRAAREEVLDLLQASRDSAVLLVGAVRLLNAALELVRTLSSETDPPT